MSYDSNGKLFCSVVTIAPGNNGFISSDSYLAVSRVNLEDTFQDGNLVYVQSNPIKLFNLGDGLEWDTSSSIPKLKLSSS